MQRPEMQQPVQDQPQDSVRLLTVICVIFFTIGMSQGAMGPAIPDLARQTGASLVATGGLVTAIYLAALVGQTAAGLLIGRLGARRIMISGMAGFVLGIIGIVTSTSLVMLLTAASCLGTGIGAILLTGNVTAAEASTGAGPLNLVNAIFGLGAIISPALVGVSIFAFDSGIHALWVIPVGMVLAAGLLFAWVPKSLAKPVGMPDDTSARPGLWIMLRAPLILCIGLFIMGYLAQEVAIITWLPVVLERSVGMSLALGAMVISWYWLLVTLARFVAAWASRFAGPLLILRIGIALCCAGGGTLWLAVIMANASLGIVAVTMLGLALGPLLPTMLAVTRAAFPRNAGLATGLVVGLGNIGGASAPLIFGMMIEIQGVVAATSLLFGLPLAMALILVVIDRQSQQHQPALARA